MRARRGAAGEISTCAGCVLRLRDEGADGIALLSGGTDGEDGPTDAAGAVLDADVLGRGPAFPARSGRRILTRNNAYHFFDPLGAPVQDGSHADERVRSPRRAGP